MNQHQLEAAQEIATIANTINTHLEAVFKNNPGMVTKLAIAVFESYLEPDEALEVDEDGTLIMHPAEVELERLKAYCRSVSSELSRAVYDSGEIVGYMQTTEWIEGLRELVGVKHGWN